MRTLTFGFAWAALLLAFAPAALAQSQGTRLAPSKGWLNDLAKGKALAAKTGKPLMVVFRCDP